MGSEKEEKIQKKIENLMNEIYQNLMNRFKEK